MPDSSRRGCSDRHWFGHADGDISELEQHRGAGIRTRDLLLPKQARYRTAPHPVISNRCKLAV
jgi:hypothetical protein